jgi:hypothetical protein
VNRPMSVDELRRAAMRAPIKTPPGVGEYMVRLVLLALVEYVNRDGAAWPGAQTLADDVDGLSRWHVRDALAVLEANGLIARDGKHGRSVVWRLQIPNVASGPATLGGRATGKRPSASADDVAGDVAGDSAGGPAPNGTELTTKSKNIRTSDHTCSELRNAGTSARVGADVTGHVTGYVTGHADCETCQGVPGFCEPDCPAFVSVNGRQAAGQPQGAKSLVADRPQEKSCSELRNAGTSARVGADVTGHVTGYVTGHADCETCQGVPGFCEPDCPAFVSVNGRQATQ